MSRSLRGKRWRVQQLVEYVCMDGSICRWVGAKQSSLEAESLPNILQALIALCIQEPTNIEGIGTWYIFIPC